MTRFRNILAERAMFDTCWESLIIKFQLRTYKPILAFERLGWENVML